MNTLMDSPERYSLKLNVRDRVIKIINLIIQPNDENIENLRELSSEAASLFEPEIHLYIDEVYMHFVKYQRLKQEFDNQTKREGDDFQRMCAEMQGERDLANESNKPNKTSGTNIQ